MTVAERIRQAALGPTPRHSDWLYGWVGGFGTPAHHALRDHSEWVSKGVSAFTGAPEIEQRMFMLFVAEALGQMDLKSI